MRAATEQGKHTQVFRIGTVNTPFLVRREEVKCNFLVTVGVFAQQFFGGFKINGRFVYTQVFAEIPHPFVVLIELLAAGNGTPRDQFVYVGIAGVVTHFFAFHARPNRRGNDFARLGNDVAEADSRMLARVDQMGVIATGGFA